MAEPVDGVYTMAPHSGWARHAEGKRSSYVTAHIALFQCMHLVDQTLMASTPSVGLMTIDVGEPLCNKLTNINQLALSL
jgi:hypothetical protein